MQILRRVIGKGGGPPPVLPHGYHPGCHGPRILLSDMPTNKRLVLMEHPVDGTFTIEQRCVELDETL